MLYGKIKQECVFYGIDIERHRVHSMAYENRNAAYDLSLFDDSTDYVSGTAVPERKEEVHKKQERKRRKNNVVSLPKEELQNNRRRKHNKFKLALGTAGGAVAAVVIGIIIVGQVRLTELNQEVITAKETLANAQSVYTQTQMKLESKLSTSDIEKYAEDTLGMTKATNTQKEFVTLSGGDKAEVSATQESDNIFAQFWNSVQNLWS